MIRIDVTGRTPIYEQLCKAVCADISKGILKPGDKMPGARTLAKELGLNPNTVAKAYTRLEQEGIVYSVAGRGCFVSQKDKNAPDALTRDFEVKAREALELGVSPQTLIGIVERLSRQLNNENEGGTDK